MDLNKVQTAIKFSDELAKYSNIATFYQRIIYYIHDHKDKDDLIVELLIYYYPKLVESNIIEFLYELEYSTNLVYILNILKKYLSEDLSENDKLNCQSLLNIIYIYSYFQTENIRLKSEIAEEYNKFEDKINEREKIYLDKITLLEQQVNFLSTKT